MTIMQAIIYCLPLILAALAIAVVLWVRKKARQQAADLFISPADKTTAGSGGGGGPKEQA